MAASSATPGMGTVLKKNGTAIAEVRAINPTVTTGEAETTHLSSDNYMEEYVPTKTGVTVAIEVNFLPTSSDHETDILLEMGDTAGPQTDTYTIDWSDSTPTVWSFTAFWTDFSPNAATDSALQGTATLRVTGTVDWSYTV